MSVQGEGISVLDSDACNKKMTKYKCEFYKADQNWEMIEMRHPHGTMHREISRCVGEWLEVDRFVHLLKAPLGAPLLRSQSTGARAPACMWIPVVMTWIHGMPQAWWCALIVDGWNLERLTKHMQSDRSPPRKCEARVTTASIGEGMDIRA